MKKTFLRFVSAALATVMLFGCINIGVFAADEQNNVTTNSTPSVTTQEGKNNTPSVKAVVQNKTIASIIAGSKIPGGFTAEEKAVLNAVALKSEALSYTDLPADAGEDVKVAITDVAHTYTVKANEIVSGLAAKWIPVGGSAIREDNSSVEFTLVNGEGSFVAADLDHVEIYYELTVSEISAETVGIIASLPYVLAGEAVTQKEVLDYYSRDGIYNKLADFSTYLGVFDILKDSFNAESQAAIAELMEKAIHKTADGDKLYFAEYIGEYRTKGLAYYYSEGAYEAIAAQLTLVRDAVNVICADPKFDEIFTKMDALMPSMGLLEKKGAIDEIKVALNEKTLVPVNANIDRTSAYLPAFATAIEAAIGNSATHDASALVLGKTVKAVADDKVSVSITVTVVTKDGQVLDTLADATTFKIGTVLSAKDVAGMKDIIANLEADLGIDTENFVCTSTGDALPEEGATVASKIAVSFVWAPVSYTIIIDGAEDQVLYGDGSGLTIVLPGSGDIATKYIYNIAGDEITVGVEDKAYTFSDISVLKEICEDGKYLVKRTALNAAREDILKFVDAMNEAMANKASVNVNGVKVPVISFIPVENAGGEISIIFRVTPYLTGVDYQGLVVDVMKVLTIDGNPFGTIKLNGNNLYDGRVYMQTVLDTVLSDNFGFDAICNMIDANGDIKDIKVTDLANITVIDTEYDVALTDKLGGKLLAAELQADGFTFPFYVTFEDYDQMADTLIKVEKALMTVKDNINFVANEGVLNIEIVMPAKFSAYYLAELLVMDQAELSDIENMELEEALSFMVSLIKPLVADEDFTLDTIENTLAKVGQSTDLSKYLTEARFSQIRRAINYLLNNANLESEASGNSYSATVSYKIRDILINRFKVDEMFLGMIAEAGVGSKGISLSFTITDNSIVEGDYDALVINPNEKNLNLLTTTKDLATVLNNAKTNTVIVLLQDVTLSSDVVIPNRVFINLNGYTITGDMTTNAAVRITNSNLTKCGGVNGELSGNFIITGGHYTADVSDMLKDGYTVEADGCVENNIYTVSADENGDVTVAIKGGFLNKENLPTDRNSLKDFIVDVAFDIALNMFTDASVAVNGETIYSVELNNLLGMLDSSMGDLADTALGCLNYEGISAFANNLLADMLDFGAMEIALVNGEAIATYEMTTKAWNVVSTIAGQADKYITLNALPAEESETKTVSVVFDPEMAEDEFASLVALFENLRKTVAIDATVSLNSIELVGKNVNADITGTVSVDVDFSDDIRYSALILAAVAYSTPAQAENCVGAIDLFFEDGDMSLIVETLDTITAAQLVSALKALASTNCADMLDAIGVENEGILDLEAVYASLLDIAGAVVARLGISGNATKLGACKVADSLASYAFTRENVRGFDVDFSVVLVDEDTAVTPEILNVEIQTTDKMVAALVTNGFIYIDAHYNGISVEDLLGNVLITTKFADGQGWSLIKGANAQSEALICTGDMLIVEAENAGGSVTETYIIVILGDANCNGITDAGDAVVMARHYVGKMTMDSFAELAADANRNNGIDGGDAVKVTGKYVKWNSYVSALN